MSRYPGFIGPSNRSTSPIADCERLINWYVEPADAGTGQPALYPTPGQTPFVTVADVSTRALFTMNGRTFTVVGTSLGEVFAGQTFTKYGTVAQDPNLAYVIVNGISGNQAGIGSGGNLYVLDLATNVLSAALLPGEVTQIGFLDGYGLWFNKTAGKIRLSNLNDFSVNDPTQFALRSDAPDNWVAMCVNPPDIWLIGSQTGSIWYDAGAFPFPFAFRVGSTFKFGCAATFSIAAAGDSVLWLSKNAEGAGIVVRARGYVPQPVSTYALETAIAGYLRTSIISDAEALVYQQGGHTFYVLRFPSAGATWAYDLRTGLWHERDTLNALTGQPEAWHARVVTAAFGKHLVGYSATGVIATLDPTVGTEVDGSAIRRLRIPPALAAADGARLYVDRFELGIEPGLGTTSGQGSDPQVMERHSFDTKTWSNQRMRSAGRQGEYGKHVVWLKNGSSRTVWVPEITITDPFPQRVVYAAIQARGLASAGAPSQAA